MASWTFTAADWFFSVSAVRAVLTLERTRERTVRFRCRRRSLCRMSFIADFVFATSTLPRVHRVAAQLVHLLCSARLRLHLALPLRVGLQQP